MGKGKNKNRKGEYGNASKEDMELLSDPIFAKASARAEGITKGWALGTYGPPKVTMALPPNSSDNGGLIAKCITEEYSDSVEVEAEGEELVVESEDVSQTLGEQDSDCTPSIRQSVSEDSVRQNVPASRPLGDEDPVGTQGVCQNANKGEGSAFNVTAGQEQVKGRVLPTHGERKVPFASLFGNNRRPSLGSQLEQIETGDGPIPIEAEDVQESWSLWKNCLVGYFGGRFPGKVALNRIVEGWKAPVKVHHHKSGWIIFQFVNSESQMKVLETSPYIIYGKPLFLKIMPQNFRFQNEGISCFPVWVQIHNLPMEYVNPRILGKICTRIGKPIHMDQLTTSKERVSYARCLVEINMETDPPQALMLKLPTGEVIEQAILYENLPKFCKHCRIVGHSEARCTKKINSKNKKVEVDKSTEELIPNNLEQGAANVAPARQTDLPSKEGQAEWVQVQTKSSNGRTANPPAIPALVNKFQALAEIPENVVEQPLTQETDSDQTQVNPTKPLSKIGEGKETTQIKQAKPLKVHPDGRDNVLKENQSKAGDKPQMLGKSEGQNHNNNLLKGKKDGEVHAQTDSGKLETTTQQSPKFQRGISVGDQQKIISQIIRKGPPAKRVHRIPNVYMNGRS